MSDFDKFFADKLGEEGQFPRKEKNWRMLSKRLDAVDLGSEINRKGIRRQLRYWQAAAACLILTASALAWTLKQSCVENARLNETIAALDATRQAQEREIAQWKTRPVREGDVAPATPVPDERTATHFDRPGTTSDKQTKAGILAPYHAKNKQKNAQVPDNQSPGALPETAVDALKDVNIARVPDPQNPVDAPGNDPAPSEAPLATQDSASGLHYPTLPVLTSPALALKAPDTMTLGAPALIQPAPNPARFKVGITASAGIPLPKEKGASLLVGQGIVAEFNLWRNLWLSASADWVHFDVSTSKYVPKYHHHHGHHQPPGGGSPNEELVSVKSTQRQQQYALGLRYNVPIKTWLRPAFRLAYSMTHVSPENITYRYEKKGWPSGPGQPGNPPKPKYFVESTESQWIDNTWRFGVGLEHETRNWSFGAWADYSKNFVSTDETFDALFLRAGLLYKFH